MGKGNRTRNSNYQDAYDMSGAGTAVKTAKASQKKDLTSTWVLIAIVALLAIALFFVIFADSGIKDRGTVVVESDNYEVTASMIPYFENSAYSNTFYQYFNLYYSYLGDSNSAYQYASQMMSSYTLKDFFSSALASTKEILILCEAAKAAGISLDADDNATIDETLASFGSNFASVFGTGVKKKDVRAALELEALAGKYYDKFHEDKAAAVTDADIQKHIEDNKKDFFVSDYLKFEVSLVAEDFADLEGEFEDAKALADKYVALIANAKTENEFKNQVIRYIIDRDFSETVAEKVTEDTLPTSEQLNTLKDALIADIISALLEDGESHKLNESDLSYAAYVYGNIYAACEDALEELVGEQAYDKESTLEEVKWLSDESTVVYSTKTIKNATDSEYKNTVYMLTAAPHLNDEETVNVGHILVKAEKEADLAAAEKEAKEILDTYLAGEKTKDAFEKLAKDKTDDSGVFYDNVTAGQMVKEFDEWIFSADRKEVGETGIVKTQFGYHVMYWNGKGENTSITNAKNGLVADQYQKFVEEGAKSLSINERYVEKNTPAETDTQTAK